MLRPRRSPPSSSRSAQRLPPRRSTTLLPRRHRARRPATILRPPPPQAAPPGWYGRPPVVQPPPIRDNTLRLSGGIALASGGYYCGYAYVPGYAYPTCSAGYSSVLGNVNLDLDLAISRATAITVGTNVMFGGYQGINSTVWEPHIDYLLRGSPYGMARGRFRIGAGLYIATVSGGSYTGPTATTTGGALRIGGGVSLLGDSPVGIGLDAIFEAGSLNGYYVSTLQLLVGPEFRF